MRLTSLAAAVLVAFVFVPASAGSAAELRDAVLVVDGVSGRVLYERNADAPRYPASLTKMMTLYLLFDALDRNRVALGTQMMVSRHAASQPPTKLGIPAGATISVDTAIRALVVRSANDVAVIVAETLGGSEHVFAEMMTEAAHTLGMSDTTFRNASGLPHAQQRTTASDMALLGRRLAYDFPKYYHYLSADEFTYNGRQFRGHNNVLREYEGADGIKTGYIRRSGFNLVTSAVRENTHIVGVVMGGRTARERDEQMMELLDDAFERAAQDRTLTSDANVPWKNESGQKTLAFYARPRVVSIIPDSLIIPIAKPGAGIDGYTLRSAQVIEGVMASGDDIMRPSRSENSPILVASLDDSAAEVNACHGAIECYDEFALVRHGGVDEKKASQESAGTNVSVANNVWVVQIGLFPNEEVAKSQLDTSGSFDTIEHAQKIVELFVESGGMEVYRARLGYFVEEMAREVCAHLKG